MKETRFFYAPDALTNQQLPQDEANHALTVLRLREGNTLNIIDGAGHLITATITVAAKHACHFQINTVADMPRQWHRRIHIAVAPTKNIDRIEWFVEKATEIGVDQITFLDTQFSQRHKINTDRLNKIVISAVKQSHKFYMPQIDDITPFSTLISQPRVGQKFIAHCYEDAELLPPNGEKPFLLDAISNPNTETENREQRTENREQNTLVLIGPEGDFSTEEVRMAMHYGYTPISLGTSRLRTETAALVAVHLLSIEN